VEYYDPTDVFGDLADALAESYPAIAPELQGEAAADATNGTGGTEAEADAGDVDADSEDVDADSDDEDENEDAKEGGAPRA
jgi:hypothetical protein